jgi:hypothetical protein
MTVFPILECQPESEQLGTPNRPKHDDERVELTMASKAVENLMCKPPFPPTAPFRPIKHNRSILD